MNDQILIFAISQIITAAGVYAAIRADLASVNARLNWHEKEIERIRENKK